MATRLLHRIGAAAAGVLGLLLVLEAVCQLLPVSTASRTGYHVDPDLLTYPPEHEFTVSTGWDLRNAQALVANRQGFVTHRDFANDLRAIALIGDSYVEASMLDSGDRPGVQLERVLTERRPVFAMGGPGSSLLDYAQRLRWAAQNFGVRDAVFLLEPFDARQSLCGSGNVHSRCLDPLSLEPRIQRQAEAGTLKRWLRHSALAQYLVSQLRFRPETVLRAMFSRNTPEHPGPSGGPARVNEPTAADVASMQRRVDAVVREFLDAVRPYQGGRLVVLVDGHRTQAPKVRSLTDLERVHLMRRLHEGGVTVIDLEPVYASHFQSSPRSLSVGPYDGHLNAIGVGLAMQAAAEALRP